MTSSRDYSYFKKHAQDVKLEDITSSERHKNIVQNLRDGDPDFRSLYILDEMRHNGEEEFIVEDGDDLDWLGYYIGESKKLKFLHVSCYPFAPVGLLEGISRNRSIQSLEVCGRIVDTTFIHLAPFFGKNVNLTNFTLGCDSIGSDECAQYFLMALHKCDSLKHLCFEVSADGSQFSDEAFNNILRVLHSQTELERLTFDEQFLGRDACATLHNTLRLGGMKKLRTLDLANGNIDDDGLLSLVAGMKHCQNLVQLSLYGNDTEITVAGLTALSDFFRSERCKLEGLNLGRLSIDDEGAIVLATGLMNYTPLKHLNLSNNVIGDAGVSALVSAITAAANESLLTLQMKDNRFSEEGIRSLSTLIRSERSCLKELDVRMMRNGNYEAVARILANALTNNTSLMNLGYSIPDAWVEFFSRLLCDASSINNIYSSNHTIEAIGDLRFRSHIDHIYQGVIRYLKLNRITRNLEPGQRQLVPMWKILIHYPDLADMKPFFKWKLTFLPLVAAWFYRARAIRNCLGESVEVFRKLSAMYKFIRGVPLLVANGYWSQRLKEARVKKRNFEEMEEQLLLKLLAKKRKLEEEEVEVLDRLG